MARKVFLHIGLPKTGTTYLQTTMWKNREQLRSRNVLLPGGSAREHLWASCVVREDPNVGMRGPKAPGSWERLLREVAAWPGDAVISHEFLASASAEQATRAVEALAPAEVHVVATGREPLGLFTASWQESVKNKGTTPIHEYGRNVSDNPLTIWNWRALDLGLVLDRWGRSVPTGHVHVLPLPKPGSPRELLWERFAGVLGVDPGEFDLSGNFPNESMGVVETETLRRINRHLDAFSSPLDRGVWIRTYLADQRLVPRKGDKYWPDENQIEDCRRRGRAAVELIRERGFDVVGDVDDLLTPATLPQRRHPDSVTEAEVAEVAVALVAEMLSDVRRLTRELNATRHQRERARRRRLVPARGRAGSRAVLRRAARRVPPAAAAYRWLRSKRRG